MRHISAAIADLDDANLRAAIADRETAWERVLAVAGEFEAAWQFESDLREDVYRRRGERVRFLHDLSEAAAESSGS